MVRYHLSIQIISHLYQETKALKNYYRNIEKENIKEISKKLIDQMVFIDTHKIF